MTEREWVAWVVDLLSSELEDDKRLDVADGEKLPYAHEVLAYKGEAPSLRRTMKYETDILVSERQGEGTWVPRVILEAKLRRINTHAVITYSEKAAAHRRVHPYLRYGIFLGGRKQYPLPGRLYRHGREFDFMVSWRQEEPDDSELSALVSLIRDEVRASRDLEEIILKSRSRSRTHYTLLRRPLELSHIGDPEHPVVGLLPEMSADH